MRQLLIPIALLAPAACSGPEPANEVAQANASVPADPLATSNAAAPDASAPDATAASGNVSRFTLNPLNKCKLVEKNEEAAGYFRHRCPGISGFAYDHIESDLRQTIAIIRPGGQTNRLSLWTIGDGGFSTLGTTFDWRGAVGKPPSTVTVRYNFDDDGESGTPDRSHLVVIRLASPACIIGTVAPGPGQSDRARAIADRDPLPGCAAS